MRWLVETDYLPVRTRTEQNPVVVDLGLGDGWQTRDPCPLIPLMTILRRGRAVEASNSSVGQISGGPELPFCYGRGRIQGRVVRGLTAYCRYYSACNTRHGS